MAVRRILDQGVGVNHFAEDLQAEPGRRNRMGADHGT